MAKLGVNISSRSLPKHVRSKGAPGLPDPKRVSKRRHYGQKHASSTRGKTSTAINVPDIPPPLIAPPSLPDTPDGKPLTIVRALVYTLLTETKDGPIFHWHAAGDQELRPWIALTNPWGTRFPSVAAVLREAEVKTTLNIDGLKEALRDAGITTSDQLVLSSDESLKTFGGMGLAVAHII
ncbi:hypothetical protein DXG01_013968 [Tephrocybe rancida]|nr:hypothetical protein DXG01_013968 [Tephrocybe rancida]